MQKWWSDGLNHRIIDTIIFIWTTSKNLATKHRTLSQNSKCCIHCRNLSMPWATLPLWFEPKHNYVGPAVTEWIYEPVGLIRAGFSAVGLFIGRKSKILQLQNVFIFQFYIRIPNFRPLGSIIKKSTWR